MSDKQSVKQEMICARLEDLEQRVQDVQDELRVLYFKIGRLVESAPEIAEIVEKAINE